MGKKGLVLAGLLAVAAFALAVFVVFKVMLDPDALKPELEKQVKRLTGLRLELQGDISLKFFPRFGFEVGPASLSSPEGFSETLVSVQRLTVETKLIPLLRGIIDANRLNIEGLDLNIVRNPQGRWNFQLLPVKDVRIHEDEVIVETLEGENYVFSYLIKGLAVQDASVTILDTMRGQRYEVRNCNINARDVASVRPFHTEISFDGSSTQPQLSGSLQLRSMVSLFPEELRFAFNDVTLNAGVEAKGLPFTQAKLALSLDAQVRAEQGEFELTRLAAEAMADGGIFAGKTQAFFNGTGSLNVEQGEATVHLSRVNGLGLQAEVAATATNVLQAPQLKAQVRTNTFDLKKLLASCSLKPHWMQRVRGLARCSFDGSVFLDKQTLKLDSNAVRIGDANLQLNASLALPRMRGFDVALAGARFDLCGVLPHGKEEDGGRKETAASKAAESKPVSLHAYQGRLRLDLADLTCGKESIGRLGLKASLQKGELKVSDLTLGMRRSSLTGTLHAHFPETGIEPDAGGASVRLKTENFRQAVAQLGYELGATQDPDVWGGVRLELKAAFNPDGYELNAPVIELDDSRFSAAVFAAKPFPSKIRIDVKGDTLDLNRYKSAETVDGKTGQRKAEADSESKKRLELPYIIRESNLSAKLAFAELRYDAFTAGNLRAGAVSNKGEITVSELQGTFFNGRVTSSGRLDLRRTPVPLAVKLSAKGMDVNAFLRALGKHPHVTGRADIQADVTSRGLSTREFFAGLSGNATALIVDGAILGLDLSSAALTTQKGMVGPKARTPFEQANIKADAKNGTVRFTQFDVRYPPNKVNGTGTISLTKNTISAELDANLQGLPVLPITLSGSLNKPDVGLNGAALVGNVVGGAVDLIGDILKAPLTLEQGIQDGIEKLFSDTKKK